MNGSDNSRSHNTTVSSIQQTICDFRDARDWRQFHSPKNLSMSIAIEAAELMEHFQWITSREAAALAQEDDQAKTAVGEELADVLIYCFALADALNYDVAEIIFDKVGKNEQKYPADKYRGRF